MTKEQFARNYAEQSRLSIAEFQRLNFHVIRCDCGSQNCDGWQIHHGNILKQWDERGITYGDGTRTTYPVAEMVFK